MTGAPDALMADPGFFSMLVRMVSSLLLVLGIAGGAIWILKYFYRPSGIQMGFLKIMAQVSLGGRKSVCIVNLGEKALVLGVSEQSISRLCVLNSSDLDRFQQVSPQNVMKFSEVLSEKIRKAVGRE